jgi:hypothetical protein
MAPPPGVNEHPMATRTWIWMNWRSKCIFVRIRRMLSSYGGKTKLSLRQHMPRSSLLGRNGGQG